MWLFGAALLIALVLFVVGFVTAAKFLFIIAAVALVIGILLFFVGRTRGPTMSRY